MTRRQRRSSRSHGSSGSSNAASKSVQVSGDGVGAFRAQHLDLSSRDLMTEAGVTQVLVNDSESPLAWLARRKGRDGRAMIAPDQFIAGERLLADFTR
ncbi:hypothetical protein BH10PSE10_BH10PSE10_10030 [soil metagenome]